LTIKSSQARARRTVLIICLYRWVYILSPLRSRLRRSGLCFETAANRSRGADLKTLFSRNDAQLVREMIPARAIRRPRFLFASNGTIRASRLHLGWIQMIDVVRLLYLRYSESGSGGAIDCWGLWIQTRRGPCSRP
jgi:hypothetical protein